jgi:ATP-binding cassette subfamily B protein/subfamily B ATP-binding cassette protein MsbA
VSPPPITGTPPVTGRDLWRYLPRVLPYVRPYRGLTAVSVLLTALTAGISLAEPWPIAIVVDSVLGNDKPPQLVSLIAGSSKTAMLALLVFASFALTVIGNGLTVVNNYVSAKVEQRMILDFRSDIFAHVQKLSMSFHDQRRTGELMARINYEASSVGNIVMAFPPLAQSLLTLIGMFAIAFALDPVLAVVSLTIVPLVYWSLGLYGTHIVPRLRNVQSLEWQSLSIVNEAMSMLRVIVSFRREQHEHRKFRTQGEQAVDARVDLTLRQTFFSLGVNTSTALGTALVFGLGAWRVMHGELRTGELLVLMSYVGSIYKPLEAISGTFGMLNEELIKLRGSMLLLDQIPEVAERDDATTLGPLRGAVAFEQVRFNYPGRRDTLCDIDFRVEPGQRVAVVGPTGAGKTTLMSLLMRFYDVQRGRIVVDGLDVRDVTLDSLREQISVVLQEPLLFSGTIAENIRYGRLDAEADEVEEAARAANAHDFVARLAQGYETHLGERGAQLSGGERQRICVARAFLKDAPILILDEPTSSIDSRTEAVILDSLQRLMEGRTTFMIAHRLSTVRRADLIVVLEHGRIAELGTHDELLRSDGLYRVLHEAQAGEQRSDDDLVAVAS